MKNILLFIGLSFTTFVFAQTPEMLWGPEFKVKGSVKFIGQNNGFVYTFRYSGDQVFFEKYGMESMNLLLSMPVDMTLKSKKERLTIEFSYILPNGNVLLLASLYNKSSDINTVFGVLIDPMGVLIKDWIELTSITDVENRTRGNFKVAFSPDNTKFLIMANIPYDQNNGKKYRMSLFNNDMDTIWQKEFGLPYTDRNAHLYDLLINNNGLVHMLFKVAQGTRKEKKQIKKADGDFYNQVFITFNGETQETSEYGLAFKNKTVLNTAIRMDTNQNIILAGFYRDSLEKEKRMNGVFFGRIKYGEQWPAYMHTQEFDTAFTAQIMTARKARKGKQVPSNYEVDHIIPTSGGGVILVAEEFYVREDCRDNPNNSMSQTCFAVFSYNSIVAVAINPQGEIVWNTLVPKESYAYGNTVTTGYSSSGGQVIMSKKEGIGWYLSYSLMVTDSTFHLLFLDSEKNFDEYGKRVSVTKTHATIWTESVAVVASINSGGEVSYSVLYNSKKEKVLMRPRVNAQTSPNSFAVFGDSKRKRTRLGRITF